ncbi:LTXXQ motif family protein [Pseudoduganella lurida]|uniref:LTXXQ motif family protein n=1 Tax=Pseudoduganella lurida TaxID=1036180 RepID=A0A562QVH1_9BURK|nr:Spy/CpxP family protein refolding chaperone [Pseudoduganella lurida]TWI60757.1 LTXXQ motif family protein [Pseudoduganella lurida]
MNVLRKSFVIGMTVIGMGAAALSAQAQETPKPRTHAYAATKFDGAQRMQARQQKLHDALKLTAQQESAWQTYLAATKREPRVGRAEHVAYKELTAPQRLEKSIAFSKARIERQEKHLAALNTFYSALTPDQQKIFDLAGGGDRPHGFRHRG